MVAADDSGPAIELLGVAKRFGPERVLQDVSFAAPRGAITVLIGPSGAGKTVTIKHIVGLFRPSSGVVRVEGKNLAAIEDDELNELRRGMGVVLQGTLPFTCGLFFSLNVYENVASPLRDRQPKWPEEKIQDVALEHLQMVGLGDRVGDMPDTLSSGMAKRAAIARALALDPRMVIIDDFDSGIDGVRLALICDLLAESHRESGATYLVTTHDMAAARALADYVAVIHEGRIVATGEAEKIFSSTDPMVSQLISGGAEGPLQLRSG